MDNLSILVADDHPFFRRGVVNTLKALFPDSKLLEAGNGLEVMDILTQTPTDIVFLDIEMPLMNGLQALQRIRNKLIQVKVIILSMSAEDHHILGMYHGKANGYLLKNTGAQELRRCIELVSSGESYYNPDIAFRLYQLLGKEENLQIPITPDFTERELQVLKDICNQRSNEEIAKRLVISVSSVKLVRAALYDKTGSKTVAGLAVYALQNGLYKPEKV